MTSSKVKSRPLRISAAFGRASARLSSTSSIWSRSILLMMSAMRECVSTPILRAKLSMKSSCSVFSTMRMVSSTTGLKESMRRISELRMSLGIWLITLAAQEGFTLERMSAAVWGCSFCR